MPWAEERYAAGTHHSSSSSIAPAARPVRGIGGVPGGGLQDTGARTGGPQANSDGRRPQKKQATTAFFALVASFAAELAAIFADIGVLVALFALVGLLLCAVVIRAEG